MFFEYQNAAWALNSNRLCSTSTPSLYHSGYFQRNTESLTTMLRDSLSGDSPSSNTQSVI